MQVSDPFFSEQQCILGLTVKATIYPEHISVLQWLVNFVEVLYKHWILKCQDWGVLFSSLSSPFNWNVEIIYSWQDKHLSAGVVALGSWFLLDLKYLARHCCHWFGTCSPLLEMLVAVVLDLSLFSWSLLFPLIKQFGICPGWLGWCLYELLYGFLNENRGETPLKKNLARCLLTGN